MDKSVIENSEFEEYAEQNLIIFLIALPRVIDINSKVNQDYERFGKKYETKALPSLTLAYKNGIKIKTLKSKIFKLENVLKQLKY
jgi:hypothetical protein